MPHQSLDRLLRTLDVTVEAFALCEVRRGFKLLAAPDSAILTHYVLAGTMHLNVPGVAPIVCGPGNVIIIPPRTAQAISADDGPALSVIAADNCALMRDGLLVYDAAAGGVGDLRYVCGLIMADFSGSFGLLDQVKAPIVADLNDFAFVRHAFAFLLDEVSRPGLGARALAGALMKSCLVLVLRRCLEQNASQPLLLGALSEPRLGKAVVAVLDAPAGKHSVASLAAAAGMSRSAFARDFSGAFGICPMEFVARTRLNHAAEMLRSTNVSVKVIAASAGFSSRSHFSRAFRDAYGADPSHFRKAADRPGRDAERRPPNSRAPFAAGGILASAQISPAGNGASVR